MVGKRKNIDAILPGKMNEYFSTKKPIIACVPDGAAKLAATEYKAAYITEPDNVNQIKDTISLVYKLFQEGNLQTPDENFINSLRKDLLTEQLAKQLNKFLRV